MPDRGLAVRAIGLHQVDAGQILVGGIHALEALARNPHEARQTRAGGDIDGFVAHFKQLVDGEHLADDHVRFDIHAHGFQAVDFLLHDGLRQAEFRNAVHQHAARQMQRLVNRDLIAQLRQIARRRQAGRPRADDGDLVAVRGGRLGMIRHVLAVPIRDKALQTADGDRFALDAAHALALALVLLRADAAADGGQRGGRGQHPISALHILVGDALDERRDVNLNRAGAAAGLRRAVEAALGLVHGHVVGIAEGDLVEVLVADVRLLRRHRAFFRVHIARNGHIT